MAMETLEGKTLGVESSSPKEVNSASKDEAEKKEEEQLEEKEEEGSVSKKCVESQRSGSSDRPTRERKKVELFSLSTPLRPTPTKSLSIEKGRGTLLRDIPNVAYQLSKRKADDNLILLHTILYGKKAKSHMVKKNIGQFSGFVWSEKEEEKQRGRVKEKLDKCVKDKLVFFCDVLDIPINRSSMKKEEVSVKVLEFLESPKASRDVLLADREKKLQQAKKRKSTGKKRKSGESSDTPAKRKRQTNKADDPSNTEEGKGEGDSDSEVTKDEDDAAPKEDTDHVETESEDEAEDEKPADKKISSKKTKEESSAGAKGKDKQASANGSKKSIENSSKRVAKSTSSPAKKQKVVHDDESSKGTSKKQSAKPQAKGSKEKGKVTKKGKAEPTREEMLEFVSKILREVDFNTATLSTILKKLSDHFGVDLSHRKPEVKEVIQDAINEMTDDEEDEISEAGSDKEKEEEEEKAEAKSNKEKEEEDEKAEAESNTEMEEEEE